MILSELKNRPLKSTGMDDDRYKTPFPVKALPLDLNIMIKERLQKAPVKKVQLSSLTAIQSDVSKRGVNGYKKTKGEPILVATINDTTYLIDGTHRATAAWAAHETEIDAHYLKFAGLDIQNSHRLNIQELDDALDKALR